MAALGILLRNLSALATEAQAMAVTDHVADQIHRQSTTMDLAYYETPPTTTPCTAPNSKRPTGRCASSPV